MNHREELLDAYEQKRMKRIDPAVLEDPYLLVMAEKAPNLLRENLQARAASLIFTIGRKEDDLIELRRLKHHMTGGTLEGTAREARKKVISDLEKEIAKLKTQLDLVKNQI